MRRQCRQKRHTVAGQEIGEPEPPRADLAEIVIEPARERAIDVADVAVAIDREKAGRRMIQIVDRVLQLLEHVLLARAVAGHIGDGPYRGLPWATSVNRRPERTHPQAEPPRGLPARSGDPHLLLNPPAI